MPWPGRGALLVGTGCTTAPGRSPPNLQKGPWPLTHAHEAHASVRRRVHVRLASPQPGLTWFCISGLAQEDTPSGGDLFGNKGTEEDTDVHYPVKSGSASWPASGGLDSFPFLCILHILFSAVLAARHGHQAGKSSPSSSNSSAFRDPVPSLRPFFQGREEGSVGERNIYRLPLVCTPTGYQTCNLHAPTGNQTSDLHARPGIKPATFQGTGWHCHRATGRAHSLF